MFNYERRIFLKRLAYLWTIGLFSRSLLAKTLKPIRKTSYYKMIFSRYHKWHGKNYFDFDKYFNKTEKSYVESCFSLVPGWKHQKNGLSLSYISYSHRIKNNKMNSSRLACGGIDSALITNQALDVIKHRNLSLPPSIPKKYIAGLGWDFEADHFKIYYHLPNVHSLEKKQISLCNKFLDNKNVKTMDLHSSVIYSQTYKNNKSFEEKVYLYPKEITPYLKKIDYEKENINSVALMITDRRGLVPQMDIARQKQDQNRSFDKLFNKTGQKIIDKNDEGVGHNWKNYTVTYNNSNDFTLYFF